MSIKNTILELHLNKNTWVPPQIAEEEIALTVRNDESARYNNEYLYIIQIQPFIDSIYIIYDEDRKPVQVRRFAIHEGYAWDRESEGFFHDHCVKVQRCGYQGGMIDQVYQYYEKLHPEWHMQRYLTKGLRVLDHIYNCVVKHTAKEMLYKSGLDELAAHIDEMDQLNLMASKPAELYDGIPIRVLRSLNCPVGATLISDADRRTFVKELNTKFQDLFQDKLNDAQCRYIIHMINGNLTIGETGRLLRSRKPDLARIWTKRLFDVFLAKERQAKEVEERCRLYGSFDPIYENYIRKITDFADDYNIIQLDYYLGFHRKEYDALIRRSNRKRDYEWQERDNKYYVRYPQTINDFCREAIYMQNCLLSYVDAMIKNDTTILLMRKNNDINKPFITIEIYQNELMQACHRFNRDCTKEEAEWILDYCSRHGITTGKFKFNADEDELF